jgi:hypothetical protein
MPVSARCSVDRDRVDGALSGEDQTRGDQQLLAKLHQQGFALRVEVVPYLRLVLPIRLTDRAYHAIILQKEEFHNGAWLWW